MPHQGQFRARLGLFRHLGGAAGWILFLLAGVFSFPCQAGDTCGSCQKPIAGDFYWFHSPARPDRVAVCKPCSQRPDKCSVCGLPLAGPHRQLEDGRRLCTADAAQGVFDEVVVQRLWAEIKHDLFPVLSGLGHLPSQNITVRLVDARQIAALGRDNRHMSAPEAGSSVGFTQAFRDDQGKWRHTIHLVNGYSRSHLGAVLAHEYAHVWLCENLSTNRLLHRDIVEGFCELVAFQVMQRQGNQLEQQLILKNSYTKGTIQTLLEARNQFQFHRVVRWMKQGSEPNLTPENLAALLDLKRDRPAGSPVLPQAVATPVPETLTLKGISGRPGRRFALINDATLQPDESAKVRVGESQLQVRCLEIGPDSVRIQVEGEDSPRELHLASTPRR